MKIQELYSDPSKWTNASNAIDSSGTPISYASRNACSWCIIGAIAKCYENYEERDKVTDKVYEYLYSIGEISVVHYNSSYEKAKELALKLDI